MTMAIGSWRKLAWFALVLTLAATARFALASTLPPLTWSRTYNGPSNSTDSLSMITKDSNGNTLAAGYDTLAGTSRWLVRKYSPAGATLWQDLYNAGGSAVAAYAVTVDDSNNVLVCGVEVTAGQGQNWRVRKYLSDGTLVWSRSHNNPTNTTDVTVAVAALPGGDAVVGGFEDRSDLGQSNNARLLRMSGVDGSVVWSRSFVSVGMDNIDGVCTDASGNIFTAGYIQPAGVAFWRIDKYDSAGTLLWTVTNTCRPGNMDGEPNSIALTPDGNLVVCGNDLITAWPNYDWMVCKYDLNGTLLWQKSYNGTAASTDYARDLGFMADGTYLIGGFQTVSGQGRNMLLQARDPATGNLLWSYTYGGSAGDDELNGIATDNCGGVTLGGTIAVSGQGANWLIQKFATPPAISLGLTQTPASPGAGAAVTYRLVATNTGCATITSLTVSDTVAAIVTGAVTDQPAGFGVVATGGASATRFVWTGAALTLAPGQSYTFTITGTVGTVCGATAAGNTGYASASDGVASAGAASNPAGFALAGPVTAVGVTSSHAPASPLNLEPVGYTLVVTNIGTATLTSLTLADSLPAGLTFGGESHMGAAGLVHSNPTGTFHVWSGPVSLTPGASLTVSVYATTGCGGATVSNRAAVSAVSACTTAQALSAADAFTLPGAAATVSLAGGLSPAQPIAGGTVRYTLVLTNVGSTPMADLTVSDTLPAGLLVTSQTATGGLAWNGSATAPAWSGPIGLAPGATVTILIDASVPAGYSGTAANTARALGTYPCGVTEQARVDTFAIAAPEPEMKDAVKIVGGLRGYLDAKRGEQATILVRPARAGAITVRIYNLNGDLIRMLTANATGGHTEVLRWDATDASGSPVPPGAYPVLIEAPGIRFRDTLAVLR